MKQDVRSGRDRSPLRLIRELALAAALGRRCLHWAARAQEHVSDTDSWISYLVTAWK